MVILALDRGRARSLVVNVPGQPAAIRPSLDAAVSATPYCLELIGGPTLTTDPALVRAPRPAPAARSDERIPA